MPVSAGICRRSGATVDNAMSEIFSNVWVKRVVSLLSPLYAVAVCWFAYMSVFYELIVYDPKTVCIMLSCISLVWLILMLYTRKQFLTKLTSLILLPGMVLPILLYFGQWWVLIPPLVTALIIFFFSGLGETAKTAWGTIFLLLYLLGSLVFFLTTSLFAPSTVTTTLAEGPSPSGLYRFRVTETTDSSNGCTKVQVETSELDRDYDLAVFQIKGLTRDVVVERPLQEEVQIEWKTETRQDITKQIDDISRDITVTLSDAQMDMLGREAYQITYSGGQTLSMMQSDYHDTYISLSPAQKAALETEDEEVKLDTLSDGELKALGITLENFRTVTLSELTDEELAALGIPEEGDVMYYNGRVVFRYYVAILEEYFDLSKQEIGLM